MTGFAGLGILDAYNFLLAHVFAEMFSVTVAGMIFFISWNARDYFENSFFVYLGIAYLFVALLDMLHTIAYDGMGIFPYSTANEATQLWLLARLIESVALATSSIFLKKELHIYKALLAWTVLASAGVASIIFGLFPDSYLPGQGLTAFKKAAELCVVALLGFTWYQYWRKKNLFSKKVFLYLFGSLAVTMISEIAFITYVGVYDLSNLIGHYFKIISFYLLYRGVIVTGFTDPYALLMQHLKQRNEALETSQRRLGRSQRILTAMLDNVPEEILLLKGDDFKIIEANKVFQNKHGLRKKEIIGKTCYEAAYGLSAPCTGEERLCPLQNIPELMGKPIIHSFLDDENRRHWMEISVWPVAEEGPHADEVVHIARDITEQKRTEELRSDVERIIRHDLKSPLNGIIGGTGMLIKDAQLSDEQRQLLKAVRDSGYSVLEMVNRSLDMHRMEEGVYQIHRTEFDICEVLKHLDARWELIKRIKKIALRLEVNGIDLPEAAPLILNADKQSIENLLANLIENAIEASPKESEVRVNVQRYNGSEYVHMDIHNNGSVPKEIRDRFFDSYITMGKSGGTGLGTYSAWLITRLHNGEISFTTDEEEGTHLLVDIPS